MDPIPLEDLALLDVLKRIDASESVEGDDKLLPRLVESGLVTDDPSWPRLTTAGIELCKSLQHRVAAGAQAEKILEQREEESGDGAGVGKGDGDGRHDGLESTHAS